jgi:iron complex transport system substrate-binding protein
VPCPDRLLNRERFAGQRVGTILRGSNLGTDDLPAGSWATAETSRVAPAELDPTSVRIDNGPCWCDWSGLCERATRTVLLWPGDYGFSVRIVSLLPSTTEILFAIGAGGDVVGVTFECDYPPEARSRRIVSTSALPSELSAAEIDTAVSAALARGEDLYHLDRDALADLDPDVVVTQDLCAVCAVDVSVVDDALAFLGCRAEVVTIDPRTLAEVDESILRLGEVTGRRASGRALVSSIQQRTARVADRVEARPRPRVAVLEWTDPPFAPGHWIPEMVSLAGGDPVIGAVGAASRRISWEDVKAAQPDVVVVAPCGYDRQATTALACDLASRGVLPPGVRVVAVDANASWARPGTRLVDGIEELAEFLHPARTRPWPSA